MQFLTTQFFFKMQYISVYAVIEDKGANGRVGVGGGEKTNQV